MNISENSDIQNKIRKYHSLPEAILLDRRIIGYPFYSVSVDLTYIGSRILELQEEFVLKCINQGLRTCREISIFLGIDEKFIERIISSLLFKELIALDEILKLTETGLDALEKQTILATVSENFFFHLDALSGKILSSFNINRIDRDRCIALKRVVLKPKLGEDLIDYHEEIQGILRFEKGQDRLELLQINKLEKIYTQWHEVDLMLYKASPDDTEINYEVFSRGSIAIEYRDSIDRLYARGEKILDAALHYDSEIDLKDIEIDSSASELSIVKISKNDVLEIERLGAQLSAINENDSFSKVCNSPKENEIRKQLKEYKQKTNISEIIHTIEHRDYLFEAFKKSKQRLMIISPWIRSSVIDKNFLTQLEHALKSNILVHILYGIKQRPGFGQQNDSKAIESLEKLTTIYSKNFIFSAVKNTHRKIVICDDLFGIVTSFNFLSFRADPNLTYRDELGVVLRDKKTIDDLYKSGLDLLDT